MHRLGLVIAVVLLLANPARAQEAKPVGMEAGSIALIDQMDWDKAKVVEVRLSEHDYSPSDLVFVRNKPYILRLNNVGVVSHDMVGGSFFGAIAIKMAQNRGVASSPRCSARSMSNQNNKWNSGLCRCAPVLTRFSVVLLVTAKAGWKAK